MNEDNNIPEELNEEQEPIGGTSGNESGDSVGSGDANLSSFDDEVVSADGDAVPSALPEETAHQPHVLDKDKKLRLSGMYENWFIDYASYVILERAIPHIEDGLKPVQRRILHVMKESDDGHYTKVAGIVGDTMHYIILVTRSYTSGILLMSEKSSKGSTP